MLCIISETADPYFNLAAEEYLFREYDRDIFMLWRSEPAVIVGKHQNTLAEINYKFIKNNNIKIARRLSGGGAVYHDPGNINFTFIRNGEEGKLIDFQKFIEPVIIVLNSLSVKAGYGGKNNIIVDNCKISGNAEHTCRNRVLHHGTLLFNSQLDNLNESLKKGEGRYRDKAVKSVRSKVTNISRYLKQETDVLEFMGLLFKYITDSNTSSRLYQLNNKDIAIINRLVEDKYSDWQWIYGYSPDYSLDCRCMTGRGEILFRLFVRKGIITDVKTISESDMTKEFMVLSKAIKGLQHREAVLRKNLEEVSGLLHISEDMVEEFTESLF
jgi:lipoate-protein ligase A